MCLLVNSASSAHYVYFVGYQVEKEERDSTGPRVNKAFKIMEDFDKQARICTFFICVQTLSIEEELLSPQCLNTLS